jgi:hypothetical protein
MKAYTFSTGGCKDGIYLEKLSKTKEGVKKLIESFFFDCSIIDECETIRDILIDDKRITVIIDDLDLGSSYKKEFELITFDFLDDTKN